MNLRMRYFWDLFILPFVIVCIQLLVIAGCTEFDYAESLRSQQIEYDFRLCQCHPSPKDSSESQPSNQAGLNCCYAKESMQNEFKLSQCLSEVNQFNKWFLGRDHYELIMIIIAVMINLPMALVCKCQKEPSPDDMPNKQCDNDLQGRSSQKSDAEPPLPSERKPVSVSDVEVKNNNFRETRERHEEYKGLVVCLIYCLIIFILFALFSVVIPLSPVMAILISLGCSIVYILIVLKVSKKSKSRLLNTGDAASSIIRRYAYYIVGLFVLLSFNLSYAKIYYQWIQERQRVVSSHFAITMRPEKFREMLKYCRAIQEYGFMADVGEIEEDLTRVIAINPTSNDLDLKIALKIAGLLRSHEPFETLLNSYNSPNGTTNLCTWVHTWMDMKAQHFPNRFKLCDKEFTPSRELAAIIIATNEKRLSLQAQHKVSDLRLIAQGPFRNVLIKELMSSLNKSGTITRPAARMDEAMYQAYKAEYERVAMELNYSELYGR